MIYIPYRLRMSRQDVTLLFSISEFGEFSNFAPFFPLLHALPFLNILACDAIRKNEKRKLILQDKLTDGARREKKSDILSKSRDNKPDCVLQFCLEI